MATYGSVSTGTIGNFYLTFNWSTTDSTVHKISWNVTAHNKPGYYRSVYDKWIRINGTDYLNEYTSSGTAYYDGNIVASGNMEWGNDVSSISVEMGFGVGSYHGYNTTASYSWNLNALISTPTVSVSIGSRTETTVAVSMSVTNDGNASIVDRYIDIFTDSRCTNKVGVITGASGTFTGLAANTTYYVRANASNGTYRGYSSVPSTSTYNYPYITAVSTTNLVIGNQQTLTLYNPLSRSCTIKMRKTNSSGTELYSGTTNTTSKAFTPTASTLYNSIPDKSNSSCCYQVIYGSSTKTTSSNYTYAVSGNNAQAPTFTDFDYKDTDSLASQLTGKNNVVNPGVLIAGLSNCNFIIPTNKKATSNYGATLDHYVFKWKSGADATSNYSSSSEVSNYVNDGDNSKISVIAYDKRNQYKQVDKNITIITPYHAKGDLNAVRRNNINNITYLKGSLSYWAGDWNNGSSRPNNLQKIEYMVNDNGQYYDITNSIINNSSQSITNKIKTYSLYDNTIQIHYNGSNNGFEIGKEYTIKIFVTTGVTNNNNIYSYDNRQLISTIVLTSGIFGMSRYKDNYGNYHYGMNTLPNPNLTFDVNGAFNAKYYNLPSYFGTNFSSANLWHKLGTLKFDRQGSFIKLICLMGHGNNGKTYQNTELDIICQRGWTGENSNSQIGCISEFHSLLTNTSNITYIDGLQLKIFYNIVTKASTIWLKTPKSYTSLYLIAYCGEKSEYIMDGSIVTTEPTASGNDVEQTGVTILASNIPPIGGVYMTTSSTNPSKIFGGSWASIGSNSSPAYTIWKRTE